MDNLWYNSELYRRFKKQLRSHYLNEVWIDSLDVQKMLRCSESTVKRLKANGSLPYKKMGNKCYFPHNFIKFMMYHDALFQYYKNRKEE